MTPLLHSCVLITGRSFLLIIASIVIAIGVTMWIDHGPKWPAVLNVICGAALVTVSLTMFRSAVHETSRRSESDNIHDLTEQRRRELVRGTSLYLRELRYRYSIRLDPVETGNQRSFTAEVNTVKLGFVPVVIIDNTSDRQGLGYVAFVHDGRRWRGPGLPCPSGQVEAVRHAARCVSPLCKEEETRF